MDAYYDTKAAREYLESIERGGDGRQLANITRVSADTIDI